MARKYNSYAIEITHMNGNKQLRECSNPESYIDTLELYKSIKENHSSSRANVIIDFIGIDGLKNKNVIFSTNRKKQNSYTIDGLINTLGDTLEKLLAENQNVHDMQSYYDKRKSELDHWLESVDISNLSDEDKVIHFNKTREVLLLRRDNKVLKDFFSTSKCAFGQLKAGYAELQKKYENSLDLGNKQRDNAINKNTGELDNKAVIVEMQYTSDKERVKLVKQYKNQFSKIVNIPERKVLACYNSCKKF